MARILWHWIAGCLTQSTRPAKGLCNVSRNFECLEPRALLTGNGIGGIEAADLNDQTIESAEVSGLLFHDLDGDGTQSSDETGLSGWRVFVDDNRNGIFESGEYETITGPGGEYRFSGLSTGSHVVSAELPTGWSVSSQHSAIASNLESASFSRLTTTDDSANPNLGISELYPLPRKSIDGQLVVSLSEATLADESRLTALREKQAALGHHTIHQSQFGLELWDIGNSISDAYNIWQTDSGIEFLEPNYIFEANQSIPDDERFSNMWALNNTGQTGGTIDADIDAPEAWRFQTSSRDVVIGVIDSGIDYTHPDLADNIWTNPGEIPGNGIDDDGNGFVDDVHGWDFFDNDSDPMDGNGHGTHVAGTIAAVGNNEIGVAGVAPNAQLMALRFLNNSGNGISYHALLALEYATMMGAEITNNSWIGDSYSAGAQYAINRAGAMGSLYVVCAGNNRNDNDLNPTYPASYLGNNVITVASTTHNDTLSSFSNYGATTVDLAAPGSNILSTNSGGGYTTKSGTSMSTPHVTGVASLLLSKRPELTPEEIRAAILEGTDPLDSLSGKTVSGGRLNAYGALLEVAPINGQFIGANHANVIASPMGLVPNSSSNGSLTKIIDNGGAGFSHEGFTPQSNNQVAAAFNGNNHHIRGDEGTASWTFTGLADGTYQVAATWANRYDNAYNVKDAPYTIRNANGDQLARTEIDQSTAPDDFIADGAAWDTIATVEVTGGTLTVQLDPGSNPNRYTVADAIRIESDLTPALTLTLDASMISEADATTPVVGKILRNHSNGDLYVNLTSTNDSELVLPQAVVIPDGLTMASFSLFARDDTETDGTQSIVVSAGATGYLSGYATIDVSDDDSALTAIIDNGGAGFSHEGFTPQSNNQVAAAFNGNNHHIRGDEGTASWTFTGLADGTYQVAATWANRYDNAYNVKDAPYTIRNANGDQLARTEIDQSTAPDDFIADGAAWDTIATVEVTGGTLTVQLDPGSNPNRYTVADAIRIARIESAARDANLADTVFANFME